LSVSVCSRVAFQSAHCIVPLKNLTAASISSSVLRETFQVNLCLMRYLKSSLFVCLLLQLGCFSWLSTCDLNLDYIYSTSKLTTYLPLWSWTLLKRPTYGRPLYSFPAFYGTGRFNTEFASTLHMFLSRARPIQSTSPYPTFPRSILILSTDLRLGSSYRSLSLWLFHQ
jgi:hypothetical protein